MTDDLTLLASTYLDGEATPDERARVEADEGLLAEVERLRTARSMLLDARWYERPGDEVRESAIAAALAAWDVQGTNVAGPGSEAPPAVRRSPVVSIERRRTYRWLTVAAAVVVVAAFGVVVAQSGDGGSNDDASTAFEAAAADTVARAETAAEFSEQGGEPPSETADALVSSDAAADDASGDDPDSGAMADAPSMATEAPAHTAAASATEAAAEPTALAVMQTSEDLGAVAADARLALQNGTTRDVPAPPCPDAAFDDIDSYVAMGTYRDRSVVVGIDVEDDRAIAVDSDTCEIVAEAPLP